jgi:energy-coupling factor transporter ATP-binding protein EcfA2
MNIYTEILDWASNKPIFIQDALRRITTNTKLTLNDTDELLSLLKKENGDATATINAVPLNITHIPTTVNTGVAYPKLIGIKHPVNVCALHDIGHLQFQKNGLTVVYGNNGSGKSSYSRVLKKLCWSRNTNIELKKNVFTPSTNTQKIDFIIDINGVETPFRWLENSPSHPALNSIFVFDSDCGNVYINNENPTQYKPIGIDILERLVVVLNYISEKLNAEISNCNVQKPSLDPSLINTETGQWYANIESKTSTDIDCYIQFSSTDSVRKRELLTLINSRDPQQNIQNLTSLKARIENYSQQFKRIEERFNDAVIEGIENLRTRYESAKQAYNIATDEINGLNTLEGFGTNPWRTLWDAAKNFAQSNGMADSHRFPSGPSLEKCVLCQQVLDEQSKQRLSSFSRFILNDISTGLNLIQNEFQQKINEYNSLSVPAFENVIELSDYIPDFRAQFDEFTELVNSSKNAIVTYFHNDGQLDIRVNSISAKIRELIPPIMSQLDQNAQLLRDRSALVTEYNELAAKEFVHDNKVAVLNYCDKYKCKTWLGKCQSQLSTNAISRKIGELMADKAIAIQHQEFINHLRYFNPELSSKVLISRTRTSQGSTFQKCTLNGITHTIDSVLSEGEKKVIALSNFLAECTIDNRKNTIIFDDPVTSLDMDYRELIASKTVELSADRQIIVFTHDLSFLRLLIDTHKSRMGAECHVVGIDKYNGISGIVTDEIPYLAKNVDERIDSIRRILREHDALVITDSHGRETKLDSARKRFRMLLERSVEEILANKTYERFSKNINLKKGNLSSFIVVEQMDIDFLLALYSKYSVTEHDGGTSTIPLLPTKSVVDQDIRDYMDWKNNFKAKHRAFVQTYN